MLVPHDSERRAVPANGPPGYSVHVRVAGGLPRVLAEGGRPAALAIDDSYVNWTDAVAHGGPEVEQGI
jgi:hypothetical protein